jgi:hypothetical protein
MGSPGEFGPGATAEVDPHDGPGKDRPVLVVAVESAGTYLAVQLTSKDHDGENDQYEREPGRPGYQIRIRAAGSSQSSSAAPTLNAA